VDSQETPGRILEIRPSGGPAPRLPTHAEPDADPAISAIAFYRQGEAFYVPANTRRIMRTNGLESRLVYEHTTYVRDIEFDSRGNLFFSEAAGAGSDGRIYLLGYLGSDDEAGPPWRTIDLDDIDGFWAGHFAFDPSDTLFISTGNRVPAAIYESRAGAFVERYTLDEPITGFAFQSARRLLMTNHGRAVYALDDFTARSTVLSDGDAGWLNDVAVITGYEGATCSITGRLLGGAEIWSLTNVYAKGPNVFWRYPSPTSARIAADGSYTLSALPPGDYWLIADIRADVGRGFEPRPRAVVCPAGGRIVNQDFRLE
jgi:WD40 repeat protein